MLTYLDMIGYTRVQLERLLKIDFIRFCMVGGSGFVINLIILTVLHDLFAIPIFIAQFFGSEIALFSNFILHNHWTYKHKKVEKTMSTLLIQFHATSWPAIVGSVIMVTATEKLLHFNNLLALITTAVTALLWNFFWSKYVIWRDVSSKEIKELVS